jgi:carbon monoxide dehydrogenase subunit G
MASVRKEISIHARPEQVWDAIRDVGALHTRLVPGFVMDCRLEGNTRVVTFANGIVVREVIVDVNEGSRRLVWSAQGGRLTHHNASVQVFAEGGERSRVVWIADLLPNEMAPAIEGMIEQGTIAMKSSLERDDA